VDTLKDILFIVGGIVGLATGIVALWAQLTDRRRRAREEELRSDQRRPAPRPRSRYPKAIPVEEIPEVIPVEPVDEAEYDDRPRPSSKLRARAKESVKFPAMAVMIGGAAGSLANLGMIVTGFASVSEKEMAEPTDAVMIFMFFCCMVASGLAIWAGYNMLKMRSYALAMFGSFAIMPGACVCMLTGVGIGIWSVVVLLKPEVREAFY